VAGDLAKYVPRNQVEVFKYDEAYGLSHEQAVEVSDHYPLGMLVRSKCVGLAGSNFEQSLTHFSSLFITLCLYAPLFF